MVRTLKDTLREQAGAKTAVWDGKDTSGAVLPDGPYTYKIDAVDTLGNPATQKQATSTIDNHFMVFIEPSPGSTLAQTVTLKASPSPYIFNTPYSILVYFEYRPKGTTTWTKISSGYVPKDANNKYVLNWEKKTPNNKTDKITVSSHY